MRIARTTTGPFKERPYYESKEIDSIATDELRSVELLPRAPEPIRIERFIEKRFNISPRYEPLPAGILGFTRFGSRGAKEVVVSSALAEEGSRAAERRINSTLAHEAGHMLLHGHLFALGLRDEARLLFGDDLDAASQKFLCRDAVGAGSANAPAYDGRWWEYQANLAIGALLLPRPLVKKALESVLVSRGHMGLVTLEEEKREEAIRRLADAFDVNPVVAQIRAEKLYPPVEGAQLTL